MPSNYEEITAQPDRLIQARQMLWYAIVSNIHHSNTSMCCIDILTTTNHDGTITLRATLYTQDEPQPCECHCGRYVIGGYMEAAHPEDYRYDERG